MWTNNVSSTQNLNNDDKVCIIDIFILHFFKSNHSITHYHQHMMRSA
jgi:hypothetical protein